MTPTRAGCGRPALARPMGLSTNPPWPVPTPLTSDSRSSTATRTDVLVRTGQRSFVVATAPPGSASIQHHIDRGATQATCRTIPGHCLVANGAPEAHGVRNAPHGAGMPEVLRWPDRSEIHAQE